MPRDYKQKIDDILESILNREISIGVVKIL